MTSSDGVFLSDFFSRARLSVRCGECARLASGPLLSRGYKVDLVRSLRYRGIEEQSGWTYYSKAAILECE